MFSDINGFEPYIGVWTVAYVEKIRLAKLLNLNFKWFFFKFLNIKNGANPFLLLALQFTLIDKYTFDILNYLHSEYCLLDTVSPYVCTIFLSYILVHMPFAYILPILHIYIHLTQNNKQNFKGR